MKCPPVCGIIVLSINNSINNILHTEGSKQFEHFQNILKYLGQQEANPVSSDALDYKSHYPLSMTLLVELMLLSQKVCAVLDKFIKSFGCIVNGLLKISLLKVFIIKYIFS